LLSMSRVIGVECIVKVVIFFVSGIVAAYAYIYVICVCLGC